MSSRTVITVGNFDGVHAGHQQIVTRAREMAAAMDAKVRVLTFYPHPATLLRPGTQPPLLMTIDQRKAALIDAGADDVQVIAPAKELLALSPEAFLADLRNKHGMAGIVEGADFRFGKARKGDVEMLRRMGAADGFETAIVQPLEKPLHDQIIVKISSSIVRWLIGRGRVSDAAVCLNRPYTLEAEIVHGEQRGRQIDVPTANLSAKDIDQVLIPADGVYAGIATLDDGSCYPAAISVGVKPTFNKRQLTVEAHLPGFTGDLYGGRMKLGFVRWLRDQTPFPNVDLLKAQLQRDIAEVSRLCDRGLVKVDAATTAR